MKIGFMHKLENALEAVFEQQHSSQVITKGVLWYLLATFLALPSIVVAIVFPPAAAAAVVIFLACTAVLYGLRVKMMADVINVGSPYAGKLPEMTGITDLWCKGIAFLAIAGFYGLLVALASGVLLWPTDFLIDHIKINEGNVVQVVAAGVALAMSSVVATIVKTALGAITEFAVLNYAGSNSFWRSLFNVPQAVSRLFRNPLAILTAVALDLLITIVQVVLTLGYVIAMLICLIPLFWLFEVVLVLFALPLFLAMNFAGDLLHSHIWAQTYLECE